MHGKKYVIDYGPRQAQGCNVYLFDDNMREVGYCNHLGVVWHPKPRKWSPLLVSQLIEVGTWTR